MRNKINFKDMPPDERRAYINAAVKRYRTRPIYQISIRRPKNIFRFYRNNARQRGYEFAMTFTHFMTYWGLPCHYCGCPIDTIGIDRLNTSVGYIPGNLVPCCKACNIAKHTDSAKDYIARCARVATKHISDISI